MNIENFTKADNLYRELRHLEATKDRLPKDMDEILYKVSKHEIERIKKIAIDDIDLQINAIKAEFEAL